MFNIISMVLGGLVVGLAARWLYPGWVPMGLGHTILLGIGGSFVAGLAGWWADSRRSGFRRGGFAPAGCLGSILGAMLLIFLARHF